MLAIYFFSILFALLWPHLSFKQVLLMHYVASARTLSALLLFYD